MLKELEKEKTDSKKIKNKELKKTNEELKKEVIFIRNFLREIRKIYKR